MRRALLWILAVVLTLAAAVYQRISGPTYSLRGKVEVSGTEVPYRLPRSAETGRDLEIPVNNAEGRLSGFIEFKRHPTEDPWTRVEMVPAGDVLSAELPAQPPAGKLAYRIVLSKDGREMPLAGGESVIVRFRGAVPPLIQIPHIIVMFLAMLFSVRAGLAALNRREHPRKLVLATCALLFLGGFILGPLMQQYAFGKLWTGFPFGTDLTDNKTLVAMIAWLAALWAGRKGRAARGWVLAASLILLIVYSIPHSLLGSELDYTKL
ncbi:MAG: hypothetical protein PHF93_09300 [Acidobacteriota bacterium]|nr:hypothetical protein [Acidobacteriota bacterium]MDD8037992.1 hypothetical protein [Acidobacteriota bacterium]